MLEWLAEEHNKNENPSGSVDKDPKVTKFGKGDNSRRNSACGHVGMGEQDMNHHNHITEKDT